MFPGNWSHYRCTLDLLSFIFIFCFILCVDNINQASTNCNFLHSIHFEHFLHLFFPYIIPSDFLVKFLEQEVCKLNWDVGFVTFTMQEIGVQLPRLLEVYDQLFKTRVWDQRKYFATELYCAFKLLGLLFLYFCSHANVTFFAMLLSYIFITINLYLSYYILNNF